MRPLAIIELPDGRGSASGRRDEEGCRILACLKPHDFTMALDESGESLSSVGFASLLRKIYEEMAATPCFIIGGPFGLARSVLEKSRHTLSLSLLTWPHELARVLLLEQIYRAECIARNIPYHH